MKVASVFLAKTEENALKLKMLVLFAHARKTGLVQLVIFSEVKYTNQIQYSCRDYIFITSIFIFIFNCNRALLSLYANTVAVMRLYLSKIMIQCFNK